MSEDVLYPNNPYAYAFFQYFSHLWDFITAKANTKQWTTETRYKMHPRLLWESFNNSDKILGVRFGKTTLYALIDIDRASLYHLYTNPEAFQELIQAFENIGLCRMVLIRSSYSKGVHIYFPLEKEVNTFELACALRMAVETAGFKEKSGQLELFPNVKTYKKNERKNDFSLYNGHRLPLQPNTGSAILDDDFHLESDDLGVFLAQMKDAAENQDMETLEKILPVAKEWHSKRYLSYSRSRNSSRLQEWKEDTETIIKEGFTDCGQTNDLIREIGKYGRVFLALAKAELAKFMVKTITNLPGYKKHCRHQHEIEKRCAQWAKIIERYWWAIGTPSTRTTNYKTMNDIGSKKPKESDFNQKRTEECQNRLKKVIQHLIDKGIVLPKVVQECFDLLCDTSKELFGMVFSMRTLMKPTYRELWHPKYKEGSKEESNPDSKESDSKETSTEPESTTSKETNAESESGTNELVKERELDNSPTNPHSKSNRVANDDIKDTELTPQPLKDSNGNGFGKTITPPILRQKNDQNLKSSKPSSNGQYSENDHTSAFMKGMCGLPPEVGFGDNSQSDSLDQNVGLSNSQENKKNNNNKNKNSFKTENQKSRNSGIIQNEFKKSEFNNQNSSEPIRKTNQSLAPETRRPPKNFDKKNLSNEQHRREDEYYEKILERDSVLRRIEAEKKTSTYQRVAKESFDTIWRILGQSKRKLNGDSNPDE